MNWGRAAFRDQGAVVIVEGFVVVTSDCGWQFVASAGGHRAAHAAVEQRPPDVAPNPTPPPLRRSATFDPNDYEPYLTTSVNEDHSFV